MSEHLKIDNPYIYIAGQTSPGGIQIKNGGIKVRRAHDVIVRGLMIRPGNETTIATPPLTDRTGLIIFNDADDTEPYNIIFDHNSVQWTTDEAASTWEPSHNTTFSHNIMAQALGISGRTDYDYLGSPTNHPYGPMVGTGGKKVTFYANLIANNRWRNPAFQSNTSGEIVNNILYGWMTGSITVQGGGNGPSFVNILSNYTKPHTSCSTVKGIYLSSPDSGSKIYSDSWSDVSGSYSAYQSNTPALESSGLTALPLSQVQQYVLANVGALRNDSVDNLVKSNFTNGTLPNNKCTIDSQSEVGGWPSGYSWIEEYANSLISSGTSSSPSVAPSPSIAPAKLGDANGDNLVSAVDYTVWHSHYKQTLSGATNGDFDDSGTVDGVDYVILINNFVR